MNCGKAFFVFISIKEFFSGAMRIHKLEVNLNYREINIRD